MTELRRLLTIALALVRQNRWLLLLVILSPFAMSGLLLWPGGHPQLDDVLAVLRQEAYYGSAIVAVGASSQLGKEERSRRIFQVLGRAIGRAEYLFALGLAGWLPMAAFVACYAGNASWLARAAGVSAPALPWFALEQLTGGVFVAALGLVCAVLLPMALATVACFAVVAGFTAAGRFGLPGPGKVLAALGGFQFSGRSAAANRGDLALTLLAAALVFALALACFQFRDLRLQE